MVLGGRSVADCLRSWATYSSFRLTKLLMLVGIAPRRLFLSSRLSKMQIKLIKRKNYNKTMFVEKILNFYRF